jgi:hypothetical protein
MQYSPKIWRHWLPTDCIHDIHCISCLTAVALRDPIALLGTQSYSWCCRIQQMTALNGRIKLPARCKSSTPCSVKASSMGAGSASSALKRP